MQTNEIEKIIKKACDIPKPKCVNIVVNTYAISQIPNPIQTVEEWRDGEGPDTLYYLFERCPTKGVDEWYVQSSTSECFITNTAHLKAIMRQIVKDYSDSRIYIETY